MKTLLRVSIWLPLMACGVRGSGVAATEVRDVAPFTGVHNAMNIVVDVVEGEEQEVVVTCDDNLLELILTEVADGVLRIDTPKGKSVRPQATCEAIITATKLVSLQGSGSGWTYASGDLPSLRTADDSGSGVVDIDGFLPAFRSGDVSGSGSLSIHGIDGNTVELETSGSGSLSATGTANDADVSASGSGSVLARRLHVTSASIQVSGSGRVELTVSDSADADVSGSGSVYLWGNPRVSKDVSGSGSVVKK
jgi:hypothetical protein